MKTLVLDFGSFISFFNAIYFISGIFIDISGYASQPHFLNADQKYLKAVIGLRPNESIHESVLHYEPVKAFYTE
jgi:hypothetical protein